MKHIFLLATLLALGLASCSDDHELRKITENSIIRVRTSVKDVVASRSNTSDYNGTDFALYISPKNETSEYTYSNVKFTKSSTSSTWSASSLLLWKDETSEYEYYAYAPASGTSGTALTDNKLSYDLSDNNIDLLTASGSGAQSAIATDGAINIVFSHVFCQFNLEINIGSTLYASTSTDNPITIVSFTNAMGKGDFNVKTGLITDTSGVTITTADGEYSAGSTAADGTYATSDYMAPGEEAVTVNIVANGTLYTYTHSSYKFEAGKSYTLKLQVGESSITAAGITESDWVDGGSSSISTH
jgi:hypothetical protein